MSQASVSTSDIPESPSTPGGSINKYKRHRRDSEDLDFSHVIPHKWTSREKAALKKDPVKFAASHTKKTVSHIEGLLSLLKEIPSLYDQVKADLGKHSALLSEIQPFSAERIIHELKEIAEKTEELDEAAREFRITSTEQLMRPEFLQIPADLLKPIPNLDLSSPSVEDLERWLAEEIKPFCLNKSVAEACILNLHFHLKKGDDSKAVALRIRNRIAADILQLK